MHMSLIFIITGKNFEKKIFDTFYLLTQLGSQKNRGKKEKIGKEKKTFWAFLFVKIIIKNNKFLIFFFKCFVMSRFLLETS